MTASSREDAIWTDTLCRAFQDALAALPASDNGLASVSRALPFPLPQGLPEVSGNRYFWARPAADEWWLGLGCSWRAQSTGERHLEAAAATAEELLSSTRMGITADDQESLRLAVWSGFQSTELLLPTVQFNSQQGRTVVTVTPRPDDPQGWEAILRQGIDSLARRDEPSSGPPPLGDRQQMPDTATWLQMAEQAIAAIRKGRLEKLVLARKVHYTASRRLSARRLLASLLHRNPHCTVFAVENDGVCWAGASPETLLDCNGEELYCEAVAGTVRRDPDIQVDHELGEWMLRDPKSRQEHAVVVEWLRDRLLPFVETLEGTESPRLLRLRGLQHLCTPFTGRLRQRARVLAIAQAIHPSPAICGMPQEAARDWLKQHESLEREAYSGLTGWIDSAGNGALNVILRCARLQDNQVELYAGAGLVADSNSLAEWEETELKLGNMIDVLGEA